MGKTNGINADRLQSFIDRIERLIEERKAIQSDIKDVFSEAKGVGYDVKTMRKVVALRAMDSADRAEQEALLDTYMHALGMIDRIESRVAAGESIRQIEKAEGVPRSTVHRVSQKAKGKTGSAEMGHPKVDVVSPPEVEALPAHDHETGEITKSGGHPDGEAEATATHAASPPDTSPRVTGMVIGNVELVFAKPADMGNPMAEADVGMPRSEAQPLDTRTFDEVAGPIPERLRRTA